MADIKSPEELSLKNKLPNRIRSKCCDFRLLEEQSEKYL